ncbi:MAG TPA: hypothetical protein VMV74_12570 [Bacteroidales bacterium]|nr:hypothetical protein [Bacteroidales bacterium]
MKTLQRILFFTAVICLIVSCSKYEGDDMNVSLKKGKAEPTTVTVPFKADFVGNYDDVSVNATCGDFPNMMVTNTGGGTGSHLGNFTHYFEFCCDVISGYYPLGHMVAYLTAANGDVLFVSCEGQVIDGRAEDHPDYVISYFRDPFVILGGTGRFAGAKGSGMTDDYNSSLDPYSHHHWTGTITLIKGNQ